jgi:hypothetical protein
MKLVSVIHWNGDKLARSPREVKLFTRGLPRRNLIRLLFLPSFSL